MTEEITTTDEVSVEEPNYKDMADKTVYALQQLAVMHDTLAMILVAPHLIEGYRQAINELPSDIMPDDLKDKLPIVEDPDVPDVHLVTGSDVERRFLEQYFGPTEYGGNGVIPRLQEFMSRQPYPVKISIEYLRHKYLDEVLLRISPPKIIQATSAANLDNILRVR